MTGPDTEKTGLHIVLVAMLLGLTGLLTYGLTAARENYGEVRTMAQTYFEHNAHSVNYRPNLSLLYGMQSTRAQDVFFLKSAALIVSYMIIIVGCLFVLKGIQAYYTLSVEHKAVSSALKTSSPGLVLISIGAMLLALTVLVPTTIDTTFDWGELVYPTEVRNPSQHLSTSSSPGMHYMTGEGNDNSHREFVPQPPK